MAISTKFWHHKVKDRVTTCLEKLEMSGSLTAVGELTKNLGNVGGKSCQGMLFVANFVWATPVFSTLSNLH